MFGLALLFVYVFFCPFSILIILLVFVLIVHLFVSYAHANLCHFFSSSWCQGLAAASACGSSWTFLFTFFNNKKDKYIVSMVGISKAFFRPITKYVIFPIKQ